jgi:protein disulfide-isomerase A1
MPRGDQINVDGSTMTETELRSTMLEMEEEMSARPVALTSMLLIWILSFAATHVAFAQTTGIGLMYENSIVPTDEIYTPAHGIETTDSGILVINGNNDYKEAVAAFTPILFDFYAPWCGNCKALEPVLDEAMKRLPPGSIAKIDATKNPDLKKRFRVDAYPHLILVKDGQASTVETRTVNSIVSLLTKASRPAISNLNSPSALEQFTSKGDIFVFYVGPADIELSAFKKFRAQAHGHLQVTNIFFAHIVVEDGQGSAGLLEQLGVPGGSSFPLVTICTAEDARCGGFQEIATPMFKAKKGLKEFIALHSVQIVNEYTTARSSQIFAHPSKRHLLMFTTATAADDPEKYAQSLAWLTEQAGGMVGDKFVHTIVSTTLQPKGGAVDGTTALTVRDDELMQEFAVQHAELPILLVVDWNEAGNTKGARRKVYAAELDVDAPSPTITKWLQDYLDGTAGVSIEYFPSELPPDEKANAESAVKKIVGRTFSQVVAAPTSRVTLLKAYSPECGHCKTLAPKYKQFAKDVNAVSGGKLQLAEINMAHNKFAFPGVKVSGYPAVFLFMDSPRGKIAENMVGASSADGEALLHFLRQNLGDDPAHAYLNGLVPSNIEDAKPRDDNDSDDGLLEEGEDDL